MPDPTPADVVLSADKAEYTYPRANVSQRFVEAAQTLAERTETTTDLLRRASEALELALSLTREFPRPSSDEGYQLSNLVTLRCQSILADITANLAEENDAAT